MDKVSALRPIRRSPNTSLNFLVRGSSSESPIGGKGKIDFIGGLKEGSGKEEENHRTEKRGKMRKMDKKREEEEEEEEEEEKDPFFPT